MCLFLTLSAFIPLVSSDLLLHLDKGISLIHEKNAVLVSGVESYKVVLDLVPQELIDSHDLCALNYSVREIFVTEIRALLKGSRRPKRFLDIIGLITGSAAAGLSLTNRFELHSLESEVKQISERQQAMKQHVVNTEARLDSVIKQQQGLLASVLTVEESLEKVLTIHSCVLRDVTTMFPTLISAWNILDRYRIPLPRIRRGLVGPEERLFLLQLLAEDFKQSVAIPRYEVPELVKFATILKPKVDLRTLSVSYVLVMPQFHAQPIKLYSIENVGYLDGRIFKVCPLGGLGMIQNRELTLVNIKQCAEGTSIFYCSDQALHYEGREVWLSPNQDCPIGQLTHLPQIRHTKFGMLILTKDSLQIDFVFKNGTHSRQTKTSTNGVHWVPYTAVKQVTTAYAILYATTTPYHGAAHMPSHSSLNITIDEFRLIPIENVTIPDKLPNLFNTVEYVSVSSSIYIWLTSLTLILIVICYRNYKGNSR